MKLKKKIKKTKQSTIIKKFILAQQLRNLKGKKRRFSRMNQMRSNHLS